MLSFISKTLCKIQFIFDPIVNRKSLVVQSLFRISVACFVLLGVTACKSTESVDTNASPADNADLEAIFWEQKESARMEFAEADVQFMTGMIGHHAQALVMSRLAPTHGASEQVQTLAARIINTQKDEIGSMQQWLRIRGQAVPQIHIEGLNLMIRGAGDHHSGHSNMPGMLTQEQLQNLDNAYGTEFNRLFLNYMIQHHKGAVIMVDELFSTAGAAQGTATFRLASGINVDQLTEIDRMKRMLEDLPDS